MTFPPWGEPRSEGGQLPAAQRASRSAAGVKPARRFERRRRRFPLPAGASGWAAPQGRPGPCAGCGAAARARVTWARRGAQRWRGTRGGCSLAPPVGGAPRSPHPPAGEAAALPACAAGLRPLRRGKGRGSRGVFSPGGAPRARKRGLHRRGDAAHPRAGLWLGGGGGGAVPGEIGNKSIPLTASV